MVGNGNLFVIDASAVLSFLLSEGVDNVDEKFRQFQNGQIELISTTLLPYEVGNSIKMSVIRKRITKPQATLLTETFLGYSIPIKPIQYQKCLKLALSENLTFYDASYLHLSQDLHIPLISLDPHLQKYL